MSEEINVLFEVRDMMIMRDTLKELGFDFTEANKGDILQIQRKYHSIMINGTTGAISFDSDDKDMVNKIKREYMVNFYKDRAVREGMKYKVNQEANGEISINLYHS